jgi:hypothetical protein
LAATNPDSEVVRFMADLTETARAFAAAYPYMFSFVIGTPVFLAVLFAARRRLASVLVAGLVLVPFAPLAIFHETAYWSPRRIGDLPLGVEDALYLFVSGSFAYALAGLVRPFPSIQASSASATARRTAQITIAALAVWTVVAFAPVGDFLASCVIAAIAGLGGIVLWPARAKAALIAGGGSSLYHGANLAGILALNPDFASAFASGASSAKIFVTEMLFQFLLAATHVLFFAWALEPKVETFSR